MLISIGAVLAIRNVGSLSDVFTLHPVQTELTPLIFVGCVAISVLAISFVFTMAGTVLDDVDFLVDVKNLAFFSGLAVGFIGYSLTIAATRRKVAA